MRMWGLSLADCLDLTDDQIEMLMTIRRPGVEEKIRTFKTLAEADAYKAAIGRK